MTPLAIFVIGQIALWVSIPLLAADPPIEPGAKPKNEGAIGSGEGPAWYSTQGLYFTGGNRIARREPAGGADGLLFDARRRLLVCESRE